LAVTRAPAERKVRDGAGFWSERSKELIKQLLKARGIKFLVCTDAASEGLNFQFCGMLVNYDLPWNPMKVEQRIGRIDRIGQKYATIRVVNLAYEDTIEAVVYSALRQRIKLFEGMVGRLQPILSRLTKQFEEFALERKENREAAKHRLAADLDQSARDAAQASLDIDEVAAEALEMPDLPPPALTLSELDLALNYPGVLPTGVEWRRLDAGSYGLRLPGMADEARVTTQAEIFDDHFESHQFLSPGGSLFERIGGESVTQTDDAVAATEGRVWMVEDRVNGACRFLALRGGRVEQCDSLGKILRTTEDQSVPVALPVDRVGKGEDVRVLA